MPDRALSCGCSVLENTGSATLDGTLLKLCKLHVDWMTGLVMAERETCAKIADDMAVDLIERGVDAIDHGDKIEEITPQQVVNGYRMIGKLIRARSQL